MQQQFGDFVATELYCPKCRRAQPVRQRLLLVLPHGELHEFLCTECGSSVGKRDVTVPPTPVRGPGVAPRVPAPGARRQRSSARARLGPR